MELDAWFLTAAERANPATTIGRRRGTDGTGGTGGTDGGGAWTEGNQVDVLVDGARYFACLLDTLVTCRAGDRVLLSDLEGNADERLGRERDTAVGAVFADLAGRGVDVLALLWRSHPVGANTGQVDNVELARAVNDAGGHAVLDHRIRRGGSHHQKIVVVERPGRPDRDEDVAFAGGIDLARGRNDDHGHRGDPKAAPLDDPRYGDHPPWHDVQVRVRGPAVADISATFRERWDDPTPPVRPSPWGVLLSARSKQPEATYRIPADDRPAHTCGPHAVQVLRTYPARRPPYPFAPEGERSIARAYLKAFGRARSIVYLEDQYLWSVDAARALSDALRRERDLRVVIVIPRYPDPAGRVVAAASRYGREMVQRELYAAGAGRVLVLDLENSCGTPIYVHSKVCIVDDVWIAVGSDNLNRRSWTHDSEISCAVVDTTRDRRAPTDPGGRGDGARLLARTTRLQLAEEHLELPDGAAAGLVDPVAFFDAMRASAERLDDWHRGGRSGPRPRGHVRHHRRDRVTRATRALLHAVHATVLDPDGRPRRLRGRGY
ncbi:MAG TPA: phospholipase D family protein [Acidimicrobiia bacterium]|nr:phospholipase D family protein [Acidimicrobiia bacterium]